MLEYDNNYIRRLIQLDLVGGLSPEEKGKLEDWINESEEHRLLFCKIKKKDKFKINLSLLFLYINKII